MSSRVAVQKTSRPGVWLLVGSLLASAPIALPGHAANTGAAARRPNVVLILADDLGWRDTGAYGSRFFETPSLDRLASEGTRFTDAYAASPLCSPTRAALLTGLDPARLRFTSPLGHEEEVVLDPRVPETGPSNQRAVAAQSRTRLPLEYVTLAEALRDAGYATAHFGKWHLGSDPYLAENQGFGHVSPGRNLAFPASYFSPYRIAGFSDGPKGEHIDERLAREAAAFMRTHRDAPFFVNLWLFSVHQPFQARPGLVEKYRQRILPGDAQANPTMGAMIESMDSAVGILLRAIDELGLAEKTLVIFLSDNGGYAWKPRRSLRPAPTSNLPLRGGKGQLFEGGLRVPLLVRWPGAVAGAAVRDQVVTSTDLYPTILELTGTPARADQTFDGVSIVPALQGRPLGREAIFTHFPHYMPRGLSPPATAVRSGAWKLIRFYAEGEGQKDLYRLYDLEHDLGERRDLSRAQPARVQELSRRIDRYLTSVAALVPIPNAAYVGAATR